MARAWPIQFGEAIYHVSSRMLGSWQQARHRLFHDARDYQGFLQRLSEAFAEFGIRLDLFPLMSNYYYLGLETPDLSRFMPSLSTASLDGVFQQTPSAAWSFAGWTHQGQSDVRRRLPPQSQPFVKWVDGLRGRKLEASNRPEDPTTKNEEEDFGCGGVGAAALRYVFVNGREVLDGFGGCRG